MRTGVVITASDTILESSCIWGRLFTETDIEISSLKRPLKPRLRLEGSWAHALCRADNNFYHWTAEVLTRLCLDGLNLESTRLLLPRALLPWHRESLTLIGRSPDIGHPASAECVEVEELIFIDFPGASGRPRAEAVNTLRESALKRLAPATKARRVYVGRQDAQHRRVENELELTSVLEKEGFDILIPSRQTVDEQAALFAAADLVVGVHGAALTNLIYIPSNCSVIEIIVPAHPVGCYYSIAAGRGADYWLLEAEAPAGGWRNPRGPGYDDIRVPVARLLALIEAAARARDNGHDRNATRTRR